MIMETNIFNLPKHPLPEELTTILAENNNARIVRIVSTGQVSEWYDQTETEFVVLLEGHTTIEFENGKTVDLLRGDTLLIKPHEKHKVSFTSTEPPCVWLCVFF
jgi:cupin 2 domain-containing protein